MGASDRWGDLASELGIEEAIASAAPAVFPKPTPLAEAPLTVTPRPPKPTTDWSRLADDLGIDASVTAAATPPPAVRRPPAAISAPAMPSAPREVRPSEPEIRSESYRERTPRPEASGDRDRPRSTGRTARPPQHEHRQPSTGASPGVPCGLDACEPAVFEARADMEVGSDERDVPVGPIDGNRDRGEGEQPKRRRRRGRGGRGRSQRGEASSSQGRGPHSFEAGDVDQPPYEPDVSDAPWSVEPSQRNAPYRTADYDEPEMLDEDGLPVSEGSQHDAEPRKRRRRRRGGRGRKRGEQGELGQSSERSVASAPKGPGDQDRFDLDDEDRLADRNAREDSSKDDTDTDLEHEMELNKGHRAVPSWEEAVGYMVTANLEARARHPESHGQHRGRSRGRGGRGQRDSRS